MSKQRLGLGIDALLGDFSEASELSSSINIEKIISDPNQPRKYFDPALISELAASIKSNGIIQPIIVEQQGDHYMIVAGERRYRAAKEAGLTEIDVVVRSFSAEQRMEIALLENIQREDLRPIEEANAYRGLIDQLKITQQELANRLGKSRSHIANTLRLLDLPTEIQQATEEGHISAGHARTLLSAQEPAQQQALYSQIVKDKLTVRQSEELVSQVNNAFKNRSGSKIYSKPISSFKEIEEQLMESLGGNRVAIKGSEQKGKIEIDYYSKDDLESLIKLLNIKVE